MDTQETEAPIIRKPTDPKQVARLEKKLVEYNERFKHFQETEPYWAPFHPTILNCRYKIALLSAVLQDGQANTHEVSRQLLKEGRIFDDRIFDSCASVIDDYCTTGGKHARGGTGLPEADPNSSHDSHADPTSP